MTIDICIEVCIVMIILLKTTNKAIISLYYIYLVSSVTILILQLITILIPIHSIVNVYYHQLL